MACSRFNPQTVLIAAIMTLGITFSITIYAIFTKTDITMKGGSLFIFGVQIKYFLNIYALIIYF